MAWESDRFSPLESTCELLKLTLVQFLDCIISPQSSHLDWFTPLLSTFLGNALQRLLQDDWTKLSLGEPTCEPKSWRRDCAVALIGSSSPYSRLQSLPPGTRRGSRVIVILI
ncbi:hypothetical protein PAMP_019279 [Pampus punctatissimus]